MKTYLVLFVAFFCLIIISLFNVSDNNTSLVFNEIDEELFYEINLENNNITTNNLKNLNFKSIIRAYPKFSNIYEERIEQKYYNFDTNLSVLENCMDMKKRYLFLLSHYGLISDKQEFQVTGIPISKIIIIGSNNDIESLKKQYEIKQVTV